MSWISGPCDEPEEERNVVPAVDDEGIDGSSAEGPSLTDEDVWAGASHFHPVLWGPNPGHWWKQF